MSIGSKKAKLVTVFVFWYFTGMRTQYKCFGKLSNISSLLLFESIVIAENFYGSG